MMHWSNIEPESTELTKAANDILRRRHLRARFFDHLFFGEQSWELLLHLYVASRGWTTIGNAAAAVNVSGATAMAIAKVLVAQGLAAQGDSSGNWEEIPIALTGEGRESIRNYLAELIEYKLTSPERD